MAKLAKLVANFRRDPVRILRYDRAARGRSALIRIVEVDREDLSVFLESAENQSLLNVKPTRS